MRGFLWDPPGSLHITTLHGSLILLGGLTPPDPALFRTLHMMADRCSAGTTTRNAVTLSLSISRSQDFDEKQVMTLMSCDKR